MKTCAFIVLFFLCVLVGHASADESPLQHVPVAYKGRFRPLDAAARLWLYDIYHAQRIKSSQRASFDSPDGAALPLLWKLQFMGPQKWEDAPFFWIHYATVKELLELEKSENTFSFNQLKRQIYQNQDSARRFLGALAAYHYIKSYRDPSNRAGSEKLELTQLASGLWVAKTKDRMEVVAASNVPTWNVLTPGTVLGHYDADTIMQNKGYVEEGLALLGAMNQFQRISETSIKALPDRHLKGEWHSLSELKTRTDNFTVYSDTIFAAIRQTYLELANAFQNNGEAKIQTLTAQLAEQLMSGYQEIAGTTYKQASGKALTYPSVNQLKAESLYYRLPLIEGCIGLYAIAVALFFLAYTTKKAGLSTYATAFMGIAFCLHTLILVLRCYILERPPVSNMFETIIYVPWVAVLASFILNYLIKNNTILAASGVASLALLVVLKMTNINSSMENVQAVLDSQYWLIIHVLMVVGSYGAFILAGICGHLYLISYAIEKKETPTMEFLARFILQSMYLGVALLIPGTILGGVWAAESWGRFWDWDPKESWAFVSSCVYLIWIHAFRFHHIRNFGLAVGAVVGLLAISFTWYGVNYILGTGLHSYGFGTGGEIYYYAFLLGELVFLGYLNRVRSWNSE